jgi:anthranilate synthase component 2
MICFIVVDLPTKLRILSILVLDNYDSFTYNLVHYIEQFSQEVVVRRNDEISIPEMLKFDAIVLSPGPGLPKDAGIMMKALEVLAEKKPILGVCLGLQALVEHYGGELYNLPTVKHGIQSKCSSFNNTVLFQNIPSPFEVGHYHSWVAKKPLPDVLEITAENKEGLIMGIKHKTLPIEAVQFHPESVMTDNGLRMIQNWCESLT